MDTFRLVSDLLLQSSDCTHVAQTCAVLRILQLVISVNLELFLIHTDEECLSSIPDKKLKNPVIAPTA